MPASAPPSTRPLRFTVLPVPAFLLSNVPVPLTVSTSPLNLPLKTAAPVLSVASAKPSYTLLPARMPLMLVMLAGVISPVMPAKDARV